MTSRGRTQTQSHWDSQEEYESMYDSQHADDNMSNLDHCRLYITNIPRGLNDDGLKAIFAKFGTLLEIHLSRDPKKKYGLVRFETPGEAKMAMMKMNKIGPLKLNITIAQKGNTKKNDDKPRRDWQDKSYSEVRDRSSSHKDDVTSVISSSKGGRNSRVQESNLADLVANDVNMEDMLDDDYGFSDILDPNLTLELENLKMEQLKVKEEQLQCKHRMIMLKQHERRPLHQSTISNRCILPDGKIVVRNVGDRNDLDASQSAGAGDSRAPPLQRNASRACVVCGQVSDSYCARCGVTPYCTAACQQRDWAERHRAVCHNLASLSKEVGITSTAKEEQPKSLAPLRRPHAVADRSQVNEDNSRSRRDDDRATVVSNGSNKSERFNRMQERAKFSSQSTSYNNERKQDDKKRNDYNKQQSSPRRSLNNNSTNNNNNVQRRLERPQSNDIPAAKVETKPVEPEKIVKPSVVPKSPQINGAPKQETAKPATLVDVTPCKKTIPKNYVMELVPIGDAVVLTVEALASTCNAARGDYVCLTMHDLFQSEFQALCEDYILECDADKEAYKATPGEVCSFFNTEDSSWYRARCVGANRLALLDCARIVTVRDTDTLRRLREKYQAMPEFCCVLESKMVEVGANLKCTILSKIPEGFKVSLENMDTGSSAGEAVVMRWIPPVEYPPAQPVIPEIPRPQIQSGARVLLVDATALDRVFVRPADTDMQFKYDDVLQNVLLAGRKARPLTEPPQMGQTVIGKFTDGMHYRALCKRISVAQNKYLLEYVEFGNVEICRNLENIFPCPPELDLKAIPSQVTMIKLVAEGGELTPPALEYVEKIKNNDEEIILDLANGESTAPSGSVATLKLAKNNEAIHKKIIEMCTPDWKKFEEKGGDVVEIAPLMYGELEYMDLPPGPVDLDIYDMSVLGSGMLCGCVKDNPHATYVFGELTRKMNEYCNSDLGKEPYLPKFEELCLAQCPPYPQWFRAVLLEQVSGAGGEQARVCYVDYGNVEVVPVTLLRKMLPEFVRGIPVLVSHLEISGFPEKCSPESLAKAMIYMKLNDEGRGELRADKTHKMEDGVYRIDVPPLLKVLGVE